MARPAPAPPTSTAALALAQADARIELDAAQDQYVRALAATKAARARRASAAKAARRVGLTWPEIGARFGGVSEVQAIRTARGGP